MPIAPEDYAKVSSYDLLVAASRGHVVFDHRVLHALVDHPELSMPGILKFAGEDHTQDRADISAELMAIFAYHPSADAIPFLLSEIRRFPDDIPDEMTEALVRIGTAAIDPILSLNLETPEVGFLLATIGASDPRIEAYIQRINEKDPEEGKFLEDLYRDYTGPEEEEPIGPFDIWEHYPEIALPELAHLPTPELEEFLVSPSAELRCLALEAFINEELEPKDLPRFLRIAEKDPDPMVRGLGWEVLREYSNDDLVLEGMLRRLEAADVPAVERASLAVGLAYEVENPKVRELMESAYADKATRAKAMEAMWRSLDPAFEKFMAPHLDDPNPDIRREALAGVGFLRLRKLTPRLEPLFGDEDYRQDALYAYAMAAPAPDTKQGMKQLAKRVEELAGGLSEEDAEVLDAALQMRLQLAGKMLPEAAPPTAPAAGPKIGRNDPCTCGSGKKYKKCCGAQA